MRSQGPLQRLRSVTSSVVCSLRPHPRPLSSAQARRRAPSIVFLDELDALVPPRSVSATGGTDQIYASVVSTLLALLDGLEDRGQVGRQGGRWYAFNAREPCYSRRCTSNGRAGGQGAGGKLTTISGGCSIAQLGRGRVWRRK